MLTLTQREYSSAKRRLTTLENRLQHSVPNHCVPVDDVGDPRIKIYRAIQAECRSTMQIFEAKGYPDDWSRWQCAWDDASWQLGRFHQA